MVPPQHKFDELQSALSAHCTVPDLKWLASGLKLSSPPTRMADRETASLCLAAGKEHIVVLPGREAEFIKALEGMGCRIAGGKKNRIVTPPLPFIS
jgi:hypothetical protein